jgi:hypothetical protein
MPGFTGNWTYVQNVLDILTPFRVILFLPEEVSIMTASLSSGWILEVLKSHLSDEEWDRIQTVMHAESWASPSARKRRWRTEEEEIPLRFTLDIDVKS